MQVLDENFLAITALVTVGMQLFFYAIAATLKFDKVTDLAGASNFILLALLTFFLRGTQFTRQTVVTLFICVWGVRLGGFLLYRVLRRKKDERFDQIRENPLAFLVFWIYQMIWVYTVSLPVIFLNAASTDVPIGAQDYIGWIFFGIGFIMETVSDQTKDAFVQRPDSRQKVLKSNFWYISRHPNYFGEILLWIGITITASSTFEANSTGAYACVLSPIFTFTILVFGSGMPSAEERADKRYKGNKEYIDYKLSTSPLIPFPPSLYVKLPDAVKKYVFLELDMFNRAFTTSLSSGEEQPGQ